MYTFQLLSCFVLCAVVTSQTCNRNSIVNGCSIPFNMPYFYKRTFTPSCNLHDLCYHCGKKFGYTQSRCDLKFRSNMLRNCRRLSNRINRNLCIKFAIDYYLAVRAAGRLFYKKNPPRVCSASWIRRCVR